MNEETKVILCECHSPEHQIIFSYYTDDEPIERMIYAQIHLVNYDNFFKRLWAGLQYIFGYHCKYGHWDEVLINPKATRELVNYFNNFLEQK